MSLFQQPQATALAEAPLVSGLVTLFADSVKFVDDRPVDDRAGPGNLNSAVSGIAT